MSPRSRGASRADCSWRELGAPRHPGARVWRWLPPLLLLARRHLSARLGASLWPVCRSRGSCECVTGGGRAGRLRPAQSRRKRLLPPARLSRPPSPSSSRRSPPASLPLLPAYFLLPLSTPSSVVSLSAGIMCRHHTHWESAWLVATFQEQQGHFVAVL